MASWQCMSPDQWCRAGFRMTIDPCGLQVGRLAKQLPRGDVSAMAASLGVKTVTLNADDIDEDDLT